MSLIKFSIDSMEVLDSMEDSLFREVRIKAFASGENVHTMPIDEDVIVRASKTIYNKPILWKYNKYLDDALGHEKDEAPCGFVPEKFHGKDNEVLLERIDNRLFIVIKALIWTRYCGRLIDIFNRDDNRKDVSVEIATIEDESFNGNKPKILDFVIAGITILGEWINPACKGCEAELLAFSEDQKKYMDKICNNYASIDNNIVKFSSVKWTNPRRKLFNKLISFSNNKELLKETYAVTGDLDNPKYVDFKFPHHMLNGDKLVIDVNGLNNALNNIDNFDDKSKEHILKHYNELSVSDDNFEDFNLSSDVYHKYLSNDKNVGDNMNKEKDMCKDTKMEEKDLEKEKMCNCSEEKEEKVAEKEDKKENKEVKEEKMGEHVVEECYSDDGKPIPCSEKVKEMAEKMAKLEEENKAYMAEIEKMADYEELKKYKEMAEAEKAKEEQMAKMNKVMCDIEEKGVKMTEDEKKKLMSKVTEFSDIDAWSNYAKSYVFDNNIGNSDMFALPYNSNRKYNSIWESL